MSFSLDLYYRPNRLLLSCLGLWPHQTTMEKLAIRSVILFFIITQGILQFSHDFEKRTDTPEYALTRAKSLTDLRFVLKIGGMIAAWEYDLDIFLESIPPVAIDFLVFVKIINTMYNSDKLKELLNGMETDWKRIQEDDERKILHAFGVGARKKTFYYAGAVYGLMGPFMVVPLIPIVQGLLPGEAALPAVNETVVRPLMFHVEFLVDVDKWYFYLLIHSYFATMAYITAVVAADTMFLVYTQHACSLLAIVGHRLAHMVDGTELDVEMRPPISSDKPYHNLIQAISHHQWSLEYIDMIESAYTVSLFFQTSINMMCISFTGFQAVSLLDHPDQSIRYGVFMVAQVCPLFFSSYPPQCITTESEILWNFDSAWYLTSIRTRQLLNLMILRCSRPCELTAGRFYVLNVEYFSTVMRTSMSYLTMLCSFRE